MDAVLRSEGRPLEDDVRATVEPRFQHDFAHVRVHTDAEAAEAARALGAAAFTVSDHIAFGASQYQPKTKGGRWLLAHELTHVVQQRAGLVSAVALADEAHAVQQIPGGAPGEAIRMSRTGDDADREADRAAGEILVGRSPSLTQASKPVAVYRSPDDAHAGEPGRGAEVVAQVRQWLEQHQFAQPQAQPTEGDRDADRKHVLLNGQDMTVSAAVQLAVAALHQPADTVRGVIVAALSPPMPQTALGATFVGRGNEVPGLPLFPVTFGDHLRIQKALEIQSLDEWLDRHGFAPPEIRDPLGDQVIIDGENSTVERVADRAIAILGGPRITFLTRPEILTHLRQRYVSARGGPQTQIVFGYTLVPAALQVVTGPSDPANPLRSQHQFSFTITRAHHAGDSPGLESSFQGTVAFNDAGNIVNIQAGGQEAIVAPLLRGWIQVSGFVQTMASLNWSQSMSGTAVISPAVQVAAGAQILVTPNFRGGPFRFLNGHVQAGVQVITGAQFSPTGVQGVASGGFVINIPF